MSYYNDETGWTKASSRWILQYGHRLNGEPDSIDERLARRGIDYYWDAYNGLHARCTPNVLWELLSGRPNTFPVPAVPEHPATQWISVTDLGMVFEPRVTPPTVAKHLRQLGLLERRDGKDAPTDAAAGLFMERPAEQSSMFPAKPGVTAIQRLWSYEVVERLRGIAADVNAANLAAEEAANQARLFPAMQITVRFPTVCTSCAASLEIGSTVEWNPQTKATRCLRCIEESATTAAVGAS